MDKRRNLNKRTEVDEMGNKQREKEEILKSISLVLFFLVVRTVEGRIFALKIGGVHE